jgi:hypothetical protein
MGSAGGAAGAGGGWGREVERSRGMPTQESDSRGTDMACSPLVVRRGGELGPFGETSYRGI